MTVSSSVLLPPHRLLPAGDAAVTVEFGSTIDPLLHARVQALDAALAALAPVGLVECVPTYRSLLVVFDPGRTSHAAMADAITAALAQPVAATTQGRRLAVPAVYGGAAGEDLPALAEARGLTEEDVVRIHTGGVYLVYMIGFIPGFTYLGGLDPRLHTPRRVSPRLTTPKGSVAIGGQQTGINPIDMPSGWHLIGRTPLTVFDPERSQRPFLFAAGDELQFEVIDQATFDALASDPLAVPRDLGPVQAGSRGG
ncbi:MAG: 5-oxoprolinase subunit PxpB [Alphaproteobacteria bacterium]|nr:MAG: 5-oxoprolinase subunit PxpB [Alphaproteobacteria bacterium]